MSSIPLAVQTPQPQSPLASIGQLLSTKDMASQIALRQAQTQQAQAAAADQAAQAAARQRQVKDIQTVQTSLNDPNHPEYATAWGKGDLSFLNGKIDPTTQLSLQTAHTKLLQDNAGLATSTIKNKQDAWGQAGETLAGLQHLYDQSEAKAPGSGAAAVAAAYPDAVGQLRQLPGLQDVNIPPAIDGTQNSLAQLAAHANSTKAFYDTVAAQKEAASKAQKEAADAAVSNAVASNLSPTGLTPEQQVQQKQAEATLAATQAQRLETARHNQVSESTARFEAGTQAQRAAAETALASGAQGDREIASLTRPHQTVVSSGQSQLQNLTEAQQLLSTDNAQAQTLAVPKILAAVSGGSGSGLRMTMAEMNNIVKGRGWRGMPPHSCKRFNPANPANPAKVSLPKK